MRRAAAVLTALLIMATVPACSGGDDEPSATGATANGSPEAATPTTGVIASSDPRAQQITDVVTEALPELRLQSVVFGVWDGDRLIVKGAIDAPSVQPRTAVDARVRVGQPMEAMLGTVLLQLAAEGKVDLDEPVEEYVPDLVNADRITPRMLANSTGGTPDYVTEPDFLARVSSDPFTGYTFDELLAYAQKSPPLFAPGSSFAYSHTEMAALVQVLEQASGQSLEDLMAARIFRPLKMKASAAHQDNAIEEPVFHAFTSQRGVYEDSTFWDPTWGFHGGMNASVDDLGKWLRALEPGRPARSCRCRGVAGARNCRARRADDDAVLRVGITRDRRLDRRQPEPQRLHGVHGAAAGPVRDHRGVVHRRTHQPGRLECLTDHQRAHRRHRQHGTDRPRLSHARGSRHCSRRSSSPSSAGRLRARRPRAWPTTR